MTTGKYDHRNCKSLFGYAAAVHIRSGGICELCGAGGGALDFDLWRQYTVEHVIGESQGGYLKAILKAWLPAIRRWPQASWPHSPTSSTSSAPSQPALLQQHNQPQPHRRINDRAHRDRAGRRRWARRRGVRRSGRCAGTQARPCPDMMGSIVGPSARGQSPRTVGHR